LNIKKKIITFVLTFGMLLALVPTLNAQAATTDFKLISDTEVTAKDAKKWAKSKGATDTFIGLADLYFKYSPDCGDVNPAIAYVQAAKETGFGRFGGIINESYNNPCGLKTAAGGGDTDPNAHQKFKSWDEGVQAHMDHLALYAGAKGYPKSNTFDPRHYATKKGVTSTVNGLGGPDRWAPSPTYGEEVSKLYQGLMDFAGVKYEKVQEDSNDDNNNETSNAVPNPGKSENKPNPLTVTEVILENQAQVIKQPTQDSINITSSIGWKTEKGDWYYYKSDNTKAIGWINPDNNWYYLNDNGEMVKGWKKDQGKSYYLDSSGILVNGWKKINNDWYLFDNSGVMKTGIQSDGVSLYYLNDTGIMETKDGWFKENNKWYYSEKSGKIKTGWFKENNNSYYLQGDGSMVTGLNKINGKTYMFNGSGVMTSGWTSQNNNWYYFNQDGTMATGWIVDGGSSYYLYDTGAMAKGWLEISGVWYNFKESGAMVTGWVTSNGDSYYLEPSTGRLLTNTTIEGYKIGSDGKKANSSSQNNTNNTKNTNDNPLINTGSSNTSNGKKTIVVDPGHNYGGDYGSSSELDGVKYSETVLNMQVASKLKAELEKRGYNVVMTRKESDRETLAVKASLDKRSTIANNAKADFFISIHHDSFDSESANGVTGLYTSMPQDASFGGRTDAARIEKSKKIAALIADNIASKLNATNRHARDQDLSVCKNVNMPAVLVETGFISNKAEAIRCADPTSQQKVAEAIAEVIAANI
jgi:N-acetylmuramoyl-L-alanine amidase